MQVRRLSPDALWIEMPLSPQSCRLVWHAMAACGLQKGRINSYRDEHFSPLYDWQPHLVEGRTVAGIFARDNVRVQAELTAEEDGTRLDFYAVHPRGGIDFGASTRFKRRLLPDIEAFLRDVPVDWQEPETYKRTVAPIASPTDFVGEAKYSPPDLGIIVALRGGHLSARERLLVWARCFAVVLGVFLGLRLHVMGLVFFAFAGWIFWNGRKMKKVDWVSFFLFAALGLLQSWPMLQSWF